MVSIHERREALLCRSQEVPGKCGGKEKDLDRPSLCLAR
jgi:hypothetical protein